jgi:hypothetical protein
MAAPFTEWDETLLERGRALSKHLAGLEPWEALRVLETALIILPHWSRLEWEELHEETKEPVDRFLDRAGQESWTVGQLVAAVVFLLDSTSRIMEKVVLREAGK